MRAKFGKCLLALIIVLALILGTLQVSAETKKSPDSPVAVVNGSIITQEDLDVEIRRVRQQFTSMGRDLTDSQLSEIKEQILEGLIRRELLHQESEKKGIKVDKAEVEKELQRMKQGFSSEDEYKKALRDRNLSEAALESHLERMMAVQELIENQFGQKATVSEPETKEYYDSHPDLFKRPEQVRASHILMKVDSQASESAKNEARGRLEEIQQKLEKGEDFGALAREYSQGPSSNRGGDLGYFRRGQMVKPFEEAAFALSAGEVSDIVETKFGYHLIKVVDRRAATTIPYGDVKEKLGEHLKQAKIQKEVGQYVDSLREKAEVKKFLTENPD